MIPLTMQQERLLDFLRSCDRTPSFREMQAELGFANLSSVSRLVGALEERGFIERRPGVPRCIRVLDTPRPLSGPSLTSFSTDDLLAELSARGITTNVTEGAQA